MEQIFNAGQKVRFNNSILAAAPAYAGKVYTILAASAAWGIGQANDWYGDYVIQSSSGEKSVASQSCLVAA